MVQHGSAHQQPMVFQVSADRAQPKIQFSLNRVQQPMVFQVSADRATRPTQAGRVWSEGHVSKVVSLMPVDRVDTETGGMAVASLETTAFDVGRFSSRPQVTWTNVATILSELAEKLDSGMLVEIAPHVRLPDVQRLGYLLTQARSTGCYVTISANAGEGSDGLSGAYPCFAPGAWCRGLY